MKEEEGGTARHENTVIKEEEGLMSSAAPECWPC